MLHRSMALACLLSVLALPLAAAQAAPADWQELPARTPFAVDTPSAFRLLALDVDAMRAELERAPKAASGVIGTEVELPTPDGDFARFRVVESSVLSPELQASRPHLRTYRGVGLDDPMARVRLGVTGDRFHARIRTIRGSWTIMERDGFGPDELVVAYRKDLPRLPFECKVEFDGSEEFEVADEEIRGKALGNVLRTYRFALTGTGEYYQFHGSIPTAEGDMTALVNALNLTYENEMGVFLQIVDFNIYTDPATDPFPNGMSIDSNMLTQNNTALNAKLGSSNYDLGHVLGQLPFSGTSGLAAVGVPCNSFNQGRGGTLAGNPRAGTFIDTVLHEIGHQMGSFHVFNSELGGCNGNRTASWAHEIGSGVTIMSYAGLCGGDNVLNDQIDVFNAGSFQRINQIVSGLPNCGTQTEIGNDGPIVDAGPAQTIPRETAFVMTGSATDPEGDTMTYSWEQYDLGPSDSHIVQTSGPLFRNFEPVDEPVRSFPFYSSYRRGSSTPWEFLSTVDRTMVFRLVVGDNHPGGGATVWASTTVQVTGDPFRVLSPNGAETFTTGDVATVTWDAGGTVDANVRILFSADEGISWTEVVASTPNDGSEDVVLACEVTTEGRVRVEGTVNGWFDLTDQNFTVVADAIPPVMTCPDPITVTAPGPEGLPKDDAQLIAFFAGVSAFDPCDPNPTIQDFAPAVFPIGDTVVAFTGTDAFGNLGLCTATVTVETGTAVPALTGTTRLIGTHPNPFNPSTTVSFELGQDERARVEVLDARGRRLRVLQDGPLSKGTHAVKWDGRDSSGSVAPSGVYFFRLIAGDEVQTRRAALLK